MEEFQFKCIRTKMNGQTECLYEGGTSAGDQLIDIDFHI